MAKISIEVDTSKKIGTVKIDGKSVKDVSSVFLSLDSFFSVDISTIEVVDDDTRKITRIVADEDGFLGSRKGKVKSSESYPGMYEVDISKDYSPAELSTQLLRRKVD